MTEDNGRLRIGIDGYNLAMARGTGIATYGRTLCRTVRESGWGLDLIYGLDVSANARPALRESLFFARLGEDLGDAAAQPKATLRRQLQRLMLSPRPRDMVEVPVTGRVIAPDLVDRLPPRERLFTRGSIFSISARYFRRFGRFMTLRVPDPPAIMHWTYPLPLKVAGARNIYTIHDLVPLRLPHTSLEDKAYYDRLIASCVEQAARIVTVSETSRRDILDLFPTDPSRVVNTYQPVDISRVVPDGDPDARLQRLFGLRRDGYLLFFGAIEPKKNLGRLIEAYLSAHIDTPLVIAGSKGWRSDQALQLLQGDGALGDARNIRQLGYLPRPLLMELIRGARAVLFPSLYEGFGLPALEALALGVPTLVGSGSSLTEVAGEAALVVDPYDVGAIGAALRRLDGDPALRARLAAAGPVQAEQFSAAAYRAAIAGLYQQVMQDRTRAGAQ